MIERKCFKYREFEHIIHNYRNIGKKELILMLSNRFEALKSRVIQKGEGSGSGVGKNRRTILREEKLKKEKTV